MPPPGPPPKKAPALPPGPRRPPPPGPPGPRGPPGPAPGGRPPPPGPRPGAAPGAARRRRRSDRLEEVEAPAQLLAIGPREVDGTRIDLDQPAAAVAHEAVRKGGLDLRGRDREGGDRVVDAGLRIIGGERKVGRRARPAAADRPEGRAGVEDVAIVGEQGRIAAVDAGDVDRLAADEIEHARIGGDHDRIAQLLRCCGAPSSSVTLTANSSGSIGSQRTP